MDLNLIRKAGVAAAFQGAQKLASMFGKPHSVRKKGAIDLVTEADLASEQIIIKTLHSRFPEHSILSEESGWNAGSDEHCWIIDPLDGTTNYANGLALYSVSIAFAIGKRTVFGIVLNPETQEMFTAVEGRGAFLNSRSICVSKKETVSESLLVTGFPYDLQNDFDGIMRRLSNCVRSSRGVRRLGSAALDLCFVACGRFEGFWEQYLHPWDMAAGALIAAEAGATITDFSNAEFSLENSEILVTNGSIHKEMLSLME